MHITDLADKKRTSLTSYRRKAQSWTTNLRLPITAPVSEVGLAEFVYRPQLTKKEDHIDVRRDEGRSTLIRRIRKERVLVTRPTNVQGLRERLAKVNSFFFERMAEAMADSQSLDLLCRMVVDEEFDIAGFLEGEDSIGCAIALARLTAADLCRVVGRQVEPTSEGKELVQQLSVLGNDVFG